MPLERKGWHSQRRSSSVCLASEQLPVTELRDASPRWRGHKKLRESSQASLQTDPHAHREVLRFPLALFELWPELVRYFGGSAGCPSSRPQQTPRLSSKLSSHKAKEIRQDIDEPRDFKVIDLFIQGRERDFHRLSESSLLNPSPFSLTASVAIQTTRFSFLHLLCVSSVSPAMHSFVEKLVAAMGATEGGV